LQSHSYCVSALERRAAHRQLARPRGMEPRSPTSRMPPCTALCWASRLPGLSSSPIREP